MSFEKSIAKVNYYSRLKMNVFKKAIDNNILVTILNIACYFDDWVVNFIFNITTLTTIKLSVDNKYFLIIIEKSEL